MSDNSQLELIREAANRPPYKQDVYVNAGQLLAEIERECVPERTCTLKEDFTEPMTLKHVQEYECSECGGLTNAQLFDESDLPRYCANCGAKVIWE